MKDALLLFLKRLKESPFSLTLIGLGICLIGVFLYRKNEIDQKHAEIKGFEVRRDQMRKNLMEFKELDKDTQKQKELLEQIEKRLVNPRDKSLNLKYFYTLSPDSKIKVDTPEQLTEAGEIGEFLEAGPYGTLKFKATVQGTYRQLVRFVYDLRGGTRFGRIISIAIKNSKGTESDNLAADLEILLLSKNKV